MRLIALLLTVALIAYLAYTQIGGDSPSAQQAKTVSTSMSKDGLPPTTRATPSGIAIERAQQVRDLNQKRTEGVDKVLDQGLGR